VWWVSGLPGCMRTIAGRKPHVGRPDGRRSPVCGRGSKQLRGELVGTEPDRSVAAVREGIRLMGHCPLWARFCHIKFGWARIRYVLFRQVRLG
jgi:hypothetical protein